MKNLRLIKAKKNDSKFIYDLRVKETEDFSFIKKKKLNFKSHDVWFKKELLNNKHLIFIIYKNKKIKCGYIRLNKKNNNTVSIVIKKKLRNKKIASTALSVLESKMPDEIFITAVVNKKNKYSIELFKKLGYIIYKKNNNFIIMKKNLNKIKIINKIEYIRSKNNGNWMDLLRLAYKKSPKESALIMSKIYRDDSKISKLVKKLIK